MNRSYRRVVITGANKGIGRASVVSVLAARDDTHVILAARSLERGEAARAEIVAEHPAWRDRL